MPDPAPQPSTLNHSTLQKLAEDGQPSTSGHWTLRDLKDLRDNVREAVQAAAFVPSGAKAMITELIDQNLSNARLVSLDAHVHVFDRGGKKTVNVAITVSEL